MTASAEVIIVRYNQPEFEARCIDSVERFTNLKQHTLTVVDNYQRDKNLGALWNELIQKSSADFVMLLNSDTTVESCWLERLITCADNTRADAVGPMTDNCGIPQQRGPRGEGVTRVEQLSGFCLLLRRSAWWKAKGFREDFPFYGQESNFLRRIQHKVICRDVLVHHEAGASVKACGRKDEERDLIRDPWKRNVEFNWSHRLAVLGCDGGEGNPFPLWKGIDQAIVEFGREGMAAKHFPNTVSRDELEAFRPSAIVLVSQRPAVIERCAQTLKPFTVPKGVWFNDLRDGSHGCFMKSAFNKVFLCFQDSPRFPWKPWAQNSGAELHYMPQGSVIHTELAPLNITRESIFIGGTHNPQFHVERKAVMSELKATVMNCGDREGRLKLEERSRELYRQSRFAVAMSPVVPGYSSIRLFNIMAYGGLPLVARYPGLDRMFTEGKHYLGWTTAREGNAVIHRWTPRTEECERIRKRAWRLQQAKHTVAARLMNIVVNLTTSDQSFWGYLN